MSAIAGLGSPRIHLRQIGSTQTLARELAAAGAPHGTVVTASEQVAGRGRQGRSWSAPAGTSLSSSWVVRDPPGLLSLAAGVAVAEVCGERAMIKWPNDVLLEGRKVAGILVEARLQESWAVLGIGINVAIDPLEFPPELRDRAGSLGLTPNDVEPTLVTLRDELERWIPAGPESILGAVRNRDALLGRPVEWEGGSGTASGIDESGRLLVTLGDGVEAKLDAGEVHLSRS